MSVFGNLTAFVLMVTIVLIAYFFIGFQQTENFERQADAAQITFFEHKLSTDLSAILQTREPASNTTISELIGHYAYYKDPTFENEFTQLNIVATVENVFDAVYGEKNYYFEVDPADIDVRMVFIVDGSISLFDDLEKLHDTLPPLIESFEGTGTGIEPIIFILKSTDSTDPHPFDCSSFDWEITVNGEIRIIDCEDLDMETVYSRAQFDSIRNLAGSSFEDWASATADRALFYDESPLSVTTLFFPISDELSTGSEPDKCKQPDYSYCEQLYSDACCDNLEIRGDGYYWCAQSDINPSCTGAATAFLNPEQCGYFFIPKPSVYDCWTCEVLGVDDQSYQFCAKCQQFKGYCEVCGEKENPPNPDFACGSQRSAKTIENAIQVMEELEREDFFIFPIKTSPCYPSLPEPDDLSPCILPPGPSNPNWGYQCWQFFSCSTGGDPEICCEQSTTDCAACQANQEHSEACVRETIDGGGCDEEFEITFPTEETITYPAGENENPLLDNDLTQQMTLLAESSANETGQLVDLTTIFDINAFQDVLRNLIIEAIDFDFRIGTLKPDKERFVSEITIPLNNGKLTTARLWLYKDRSPHLIQKAETDISKVNLPPTAYFVITPLPYCGDPENCSVGFNGTESTDPNLEDPVFGETLYFEWDVIPQNDSSTDYADDSNVNELELFSLDLPDHPSDSQSGEDSKRYYDISLTVTDEGNLDIPGPDSESLSNTKTVVGYCVGSGCQPDLLYIFMPIKWGTTATDYQEYLSSAQEECQQIKDSMPCPTAQISCAYVSADAEGTLSFNCDVEPIGGTCVSLSGSVVLPAIHNCAIDAGLNDPSLNWNTEQRVLGLIPTGMPFCGGGGVVGYTMMYYDTAVDRTGWPYIGVHELGHTYGLCDEYSLSAWNRQNNDYGCPNPWPGSIPGCGLNCGDSCQEENPWTCLSAMGPAFQLPKTIPWPEPDYDSTIIYRDYDNKPDGTKFALGKSDKLHIMSYVGCALEPYS